MTSEKKASKKKRAEPYSLWNHHLTSTGPAVLMVALLAFIAVSVLPGYSSSRRTALAPAQTAIGPQGTVVTPTLDVEHAVSRIVQSGGGTVTTTAMDGTVFTLIIRANSLLSAARITMTPVSAVGGLPFGGGLAAAVQLQPDGLRLFDFATLVIEPPQSLSPSQESPFSWDQAGDDFHLFPLQLPNSVKRENAKGSGPQLNPRGLVLKLLHFSGYGVGRGTEADRTAQQHREPSNSEARFEQKLETIMGRERSRQLAVAESATELKFETASADEDDPEYVDDIVESLEDEYNDVVKPAMDAALLSKDDRELQCARLKALGWNRQVALVVPEDLKGKKAKFFKKAAKAITKFLQKDYEIEAENASRRCSKDHKPEEVVTLLGITRQQQLLGFDSSKTVEDAERCAHFELEFDSETELNDPAATVKTRVHATVPIGLRWISTPGDDIPGKAPIEYRSFVWTPKDPDCTAATTTQGSVFRVISFNIDLNPKFIGGCSSQGNGEVNIISVDIDPGLPSESVKVTCRNDSQPPADVFQVIWVGTFGEFHIDETDVTGAIVIAEWERGSGSLIARKAYSRDGLFDGFPMTERTMINLWHRPE